MTDRETTELQVRAIAFEQRGVWIVQGVEYDIVARARDIADIPRAFMRAVVENVCIGAELGREPLEGIPAAPEEFREIFERAATEVRPVDPVSLPGVPKPPSVSIRLVPQAA